MEIALKFKTKQSKNCTVTDKFSHLPKNYYVCQMIAVKECHSKLLLARISSFHKDKVLAWLSISKIYVLKASFSKNVLQITGINFLPTIS